MVPRRKKGIGAKDPVLGVGAMMVRTIRVVSYRQGIFVEELATGSKTGKHLRIRLRARGLHFTRKAFDHDIRQLKDAGLITARRIPRDPGEYRGAQAVYELTEDGWDEVHAWRQYLEDREREEREHREWYERYILLFSEDDSDNDWDADFDYDID
jgi:DNA-binding transcriptional ArsR family regulator